MEAGGRTPILFLRCFRKVYDLEIKVPWVKDRSDCSILYLCSPLNRTDEQPCPDGDKCHCLHSAGCSSICPEDPRLEGKPGLAWTQQGPSAYSSAEILQVWVAPQFLDWVFVFKVKVKLAEGARSLWRVRGKAVWSQSAGKGG